MLKNIVIIGVYKITIGRDITGLRHNEVRMLTIACLNVCSCEEALLLLWEMWLTQKKKSLQQLAKKLSLDTQEKEKTPVSASNNLLGLFTLNRKSAILNLPYRDLKVSLQRDPSGGPHLPTVEFHYRFMKKHLGLTLMYEHTFILPEIIYDPSLILSPHNFLFGILFFFGAFKATNLISMEQLRGLTIGGGRQQKPIPLKPEMADHYVFCKVTKEGGKVCIFPKEKMDPSSAHSGQSPRSVGFCTPGSTIAAPYGGGLILNKSGLVGDAEQNLVLKHASIRTFLDHYIPRTLGINVQPLISGLEPNAPLMRAITRIGRWLDKRRPRHLTDAQKATVEQDPDLQEAIQKRDRAEQRAVQTSSPEAIEKLERLKDDVKKTRNRLLYRYRKQVREEFDDEQAVIDIERQLSGMALGNEAKETLVEEQMLLAQIHLLSKLLTWPTSRSVEEELRRRDAGVEALRMYCGVLEGGPRRGRRPKAALHPHPRSRPRKHLATLMTGARCMMRFCQRGRVMLSAPPRSISAMQRSLGGVLSVIRPPGRRITGAFINTHGLRTWAAISGMSTSSISRTGSRRGAAGARSNWNTRCMCVQSHAELVHDPWAVVF
ncbi:uncharacterized protein PADG_01415 [Paracoccidioides brasiliensis Pb18]|uniref:Uncharacterized protein n=1 Tax=Paracoccidioides brasiliensis (strain Pb18) TaxID=502780 RepID=C1G399_PARBD|nr:uncharacterized protein PADG_01415 [Paracoccidioides brasiliensis Pb18]EEH45265.2 hypothetical protein PADG_01415 [Paracoccidioides brasiliensis Pb18]